MSQPDKNLDQGKFFAKKNVILWAAIIGIIFAFFSIAPQINLRYVRGEQYNGIYAINDLDEPAYAAYLQSQIDGKPRRNSPYSGVQDSLESPQKESLFSIQYFSSYPIVSVARLLNLSSTSAMILLSVITGFFSAVVLFWLIYIFTGEIPLALAGTFIVLFGGALAAGQGSLMIIFFPENVQYYLSLMFTRRTNPAVSFPIIFLFFIAVWKFISAQQRSAKILSGILSLSCFIFTVYTYFFHWTTELAWCTGLIILWTIFRFEDIKKNIYYLFCFGICALLAMIPYCLLLLNRSTSMDSVQLLSLTHQPDLFRAPEIISGLAILLYLTAHKFKWINLRERENLFLFSLNLVAPIVFNQQILTGRSLQPFHYQLFCANYISVLSLIMIVFKLLKSHLSPQNFYKTILVISGIMILIGYLDTIFGASYLEKLNIQRDELVPVAQKIKSISQNSQPTATEMQSVVLSFDFAKDSYVNSIDLPALTSTPIMWSPHLLMFPDIDSKEDLSRLKKILYYQNFDKNRLKEELKNKNTLFLMGFFGAKRVLPILADDFKPVTEEEMDELAEEYEKFRRNFSIEDAQNPIISFLIINNKTKSDLSAVDRWYERDDGQIVGEYTLYHLKLRNR
jgi:hypothetical protein